MYSKSPKMAIKTYLPDSAESDDMHFPDQKLSRFPELKISSEQPNPARSINMISRVCVRSKRVKINNNKL